MSTTKSSKTDKTDKYSKKHFSLLPKDESRFWSQVFVCGANNCWNHTGGTINKDGSGRFHLKGKKILARRVAFGLQYGYIPSCDIKQICGNSSCLNPAHLEPEVKDSEWTGPSNNYNLL